MPFRFRKSIKILPGIKINIGKKGITSASVGGKGLGLNINKKGVRSTVGIPGTGVSYSSSTGAAPHPSQPASGNTSSGGCLGALLSIPFQILGALLNGLFWLLRAMLQGIRAGWGFIIATPQRRMVSLISGLSIMGLCSCCFLLTLAQATLFPSPTATFDMPALQTRIYKTEVAKVTLSAPPPTNTLIPTLTATLTLGPTETPAPSATLAPTDTPEPSATTYVAPPEPTYPEGVTAICKDGTYSYSQTRSGTCSGHKGVARWIVNLP